MNWRTWIYGRLSTLTLVPATSVFAAGALVGSPSERPFIVYRVQDEYPVFKDAQRTIRSTRSAEVWAYDDSGSYMNIDAILAECQTTLVGPIAEAGAVCCEWVSDGSELFDDDFKALARVGSYQLIGASG